MMTQFIDLRISIEPGLPSDPPMMIPKIEVLPHGEDGQPFRYRQTAWFQGLLFSGKNQRSQRGLGAAGCHHLASPLRDNVIC